MFISIDSAVALLTLTAMEIVLGIDNLIFISVLSAKAPHALQKRIRVVGMALALVFRLGLLFSIGWVMSLKDPWLEVAGKSFSGRDAILILGGLFLIFKATFELHEKVEGAESKTNERAAQPKKPFALFLQIIALDLVFSLDSVITAVGMANEIWIMVAAMVISVVAMLLFAGKVHSIIHQHPTLVILALAFLLMIGTTLVIEGMGAHVSKGYLYFSMAFSLAVEALNIRRRKKQLRNP